LDAQRLNPGQAGRTPPPSAEACRAEVAGILDFPDFAAAPQLRNFLEYIVEEALANRGDQLKERNIAVHALSRDADFDPRLDCVVRVMAGKLRRSLERYYHGPGASAELRIEVPRGGYRPVFRRVETVNGSPAPAPHWPAQASGPSVVAVVRPVLAVVPFLPLTSGSEEQALAEALACEVCVQLRKFRWLEVLDYLVTRRWQQEYGAEFVARDAHRCDFTLGGTCRRQAAQLRLTVQLTAVNDGHLRWADQFDLASECDSFAAEDEIVTRIRAGVGAALEQAVGRSRQVNSMSRPSRRRVASAATGLPPVTACPPEPERQPAAVPKRPW
jgi:TolB-like protein